MLSSLASCSVYQDYQSRQPSNILETEAALTQAGFRRVAIETPAQNGAVEALPLHRLNRYQSTKGVVFWYADPDLCSCLYEGDQNAFNRYSALIQQKEDIARYVSEANQEEVAPLGAFGNSFPPPFFWGGWPVMTYYGGYGGRPYWGHGGGGGGGPHWGHPGGGGRRGGHGR